MRVWLVRAVVLVLRTGLVGGGVPRRPSQRFLSGDGAALAGRGDVGGKWCLSLGPHVSACCLGRKSNHCP